MHSVIFIYCTSFKLAPERDTMNEFGGVESSRHQVTGARRYLSGCKFYLAYSLYGIHKFVNSVFCKEFVNHSSEIKTTKCPYCGHYKEVCGACNNPSCDSPAAGA